MKKNFKKVLSLLLILVLAMSMFAACGSSEEAPAEGEESTAPDATGEVAEGDEAAPSGASISQSSDIVASMAVDFTTMDPLDTSDTLSGGIQRLMMDGFFGFDDEMTLIPMLATEYTANDDATEFVLTLREGVTFSDGTPWNAEAAKANLDRWADKSLGLKRTSLLSNNIGSVEVTGEYEVKVTLTAPFGAFISTLAHPACVIVSPAQIEKGVEVVAAEPVGTGQYTFVEWVAGEHATIQLNKEWWGYEAGLADADAGFNTITFKPVSEGATRVAMLQAGDADVIWTVPTESVALLQGDDTVSVQVTDGIVVRWIMLNTQKAPFDDVLVRQAMDYAIDKNAYAAVVWNGMSTPAESVLGPAVQFYKANSREYNPEKAMELLAEAGYPDGFETTIMCNTSTLNVKQAEFLQQQLAQVGITLNINALESAVLNQRVQDVATSGAEAEVEIYLSGWSPSTGDADWGIRPLLHTESFPPNSFNIAYYDNADVDKLIYDGLLTADPASREAAYHEIQDILFEEVPLVNLGVDSNTIATSTKIDGVKIFPDGAINMRNGKLYE